MPTEIYNIHKIKNIILHFSNYFKISLYFPLLLGKFLHLQRYICIAVFTCLEFERLSHSCVCVKVRHSCASLLIIVLNYKFSSLVALLSTA